MTTDPTSKEKLDLSALRQKIEARIAEIQQEQSGKTPSGVSAAASCAEKNPSSPPTLHASDRTQGAYQNIAPPPPSLSSLLATENPAPIPRAHYPKAPALEDLPKADLPPKPSSALDQLTKASSRPKDASLRFPETSDPLALSLDWVVSAVA